MKRKYIEVDASGFVQVADDWHAYWLGFIAADGVIADKKNSFLSISVSEKDAELLHVFIDGLGVDNPVVSYMSNGYGSYPTAKITLHSTPLVNALALWGIGPRKSLNLKWPDNLQDDLFPAYIRGFFDGDGTIYIRRRSNHQTKWIEPVCRFISGSVPFLMRLEQELQSRGVETKKVYRNQQSNAFFLTVSSRRENVLAFHDLIYAGCTVCLKRKQEVFQEVFAYHNNHPRGVVRDYPRNPRNNAPDGYYMAKDAMKQLKMSETTFRYHVNTGKISRYVPDGYKQGFYSITEIDQLANTRR